MDRPVLSPPLSVVLIVPYCGNGRRACATLRLDCTVGSVKLGYGGVMPAATAWADVIWELSSVIAFATPYLAMRSFTSSSGTWLKLSRFACRFEPFDPL